MNEQELKNIIEAVLFAVDHPLNMKQLEALFAEESSPGDDAIKQALASIAADCESRSVELKEVNSGYRFQVKQDYAEWVSRLWEEKPARYSRATLETLALIAYRQPITRAEIEEVRGVSVSSQIIKTLTERDWVKVVGHRDVPGKPALYATTKNFLDYFNLASLEDLPSLAEIRDIDSINAELDLGLPEEEKQAQTDIQSTDAGDSETADDGNEADIEAGIDIEAEINSAMELAESIQQTSAAATTENAEAVDAEQELPGAGSDPAPQAVANDTEALNDNAHVNESEANLATADDVADEESADAESVGDEAVSVDVVAEEAETDNDNEVKAVATDDAVNDDTAVTDPTELSAPLTAEN